MSDRSATPAVILAGGLARRIGGGDKPLRVVGGQTLLSRVVARLRPQVDPLLLSANGDPARFAALGLPVLADPVGGFPGPLAGILAALDWAATHRPDASHILSVPGDCPFLPRDLVARLHDARLAENATLAVATSGGFAHPATGLWDVRLRDELRAALQADQRKVGAFTTRYKLARVDWPTVPFDPFFNANTPNDFTEAERLAALDDDGNVARHPRLPSA